MSRFATIAAAVLATTAAAFFGVDGIRAQPVDTDPVPEVLLRGLPQAKEAYLAKQLKPIRAQGTDRVRIDQEAIDKVKTDAAARARGQAFGKLMIHDRDGDGRITVLEVRQSLGPRIFRVPPTMSPERAQARLDKFVKTEMAADADKDGVITFAEMLAFANGQATTRAATAAAPLNKLLDLDPNRDGVLTAAELEGLALAAYARFDRNRNGLIDGDEITEVRNAQKAAKTKGRVGPTMGKTVNCVLPKAEAADEVVLIGAYRGDSVSSVAVSGPDSSTSVATISIEPGSKPIYLVVAATSDVVWHVEGEVSRIARMVVQPRRTEVGPGAAVVGVPAEKVTFLTPGACFGSFSKPESGGGRRARAIVQTALGHEVATVIAASTFSAVAIPSGKPIPPTPAKDSTVIQTPYGPRPAKGIDYETWSNLRRRYPAGIARFPVKDVVAPGPVTEYDVLPREAGLVQLMEQGAVTRLEDGYFLIRKPIPRLPAGLGRGSRPAFMLGKGVPEPSDSSSRTCIISEETGQPLHPYPGCR